jgi:predicted dinucleotide-utilizing enzyme
VRVAVLGAAGLLGRAIVRDLQDSREVTGIVELDRRRSRAAGADIAAVDAADRQQLTLALEPADVVVNAAGAGVNDAAMDAALAARCHYIDLGGPPAVTARQLQRTQDWEQAGLLALLGCGARPGITSLLAVRAAGELEAVESVRCATAHHDPDPPPGVSLPDTLESLLSQVGDAPVVLRDGHEVTLKPCLDGGEVDFPAPVGPRACFHVPGGEILTLGGFLHATALDVRMALAPRELTSLRQIALGAPAPPIGAQSALTTSAHVAELVGVREGVPTRVQATAVAGPHEAWGAGGTVVVCAAVSAAVVRLLARGALLDALGAGPPSGVLMPEQALTPDLLFPELERRGAAFSTTRSEVAVT